MSRVFALKNQQNYFLMNCHQNLKETLFCGFCCLIIFWMCFVILFIMGLWVFFFNELSFLGVLNQVFDILQFVLILPWEYTNHLRSGRSSRAIERQMYFAEIPQNLMFRENQTDMASNGFPATKNGQSSTCKLEEDFDVKVDSICAVNLDVFLKSDVTLKFFLESADPEAGICGVIM